MKTLQELKEEQMRNSEFIKEYEAIQPEIDVVRAVIDTKTSQKGEESQCQKEQIRNINYIV